MGILREIESHIKFTGDDERLKPLYLSFPDFMCVIFVPNKGCSSA
jgi:hypothetical protein